MSGTWNQFLWNDGTLRGPAVSPVFPGGRTNERKRRWNLHGAVWVSRRSAQSGGN
jgi:hypothetical protein